MRGCSGDMQILLQPNTETSHPLNAANAIRHHFLAAGAQLVQFLDYLVAGVLLSCVAAVAWTIIFPL